jgi:Kef-type K+ transport system membrane component KefB/nucleotide-binding universal stress UspA family protein
VLTPVPEHELLIFWVQLVVLLGAARGLGGLMQRWNQPPVIGELAAGVILGPSIFGRLAPGAAGWIFPGGEVESALILAIAWLGIALLLVVTGFETDLALLRRLGRPLIGLSTGSLLVPLVVGFGFGYVVPQAFWGPQADRVSFALFLGVAMSISALPVIAKILGDMRLMRRDVGQLTMASAMINDLVGWILLGVVVGIFTAGSVDLGALGLTILSVAAFLVASLTVGQRFADGILRRARATAGFSGALTATLFVTFVLAAITQGLGVEAVLGALVAGVVLGRSRYQRDDVRHTIEALSNSVFAPIFFATAGLYVDLAVLASPSALLWTLGLLLTAAATKLIGSFVGGRFSGLSPTASLAAGIGLNARGAMEIVLATIGFSLGALNEASYGMVVVLAVATSMAVPPLLRPVLRRLQPSAEELERLDREERLAQMVLGGVRSVLLPTRGGLNSAVAARVVDAVLQPDVSVTVLTVSTPTSGTEDADLEPLLAVLADRTSEVRNQEAADPGTAILAEAGLGYGLVVLGLNDDFGGSHELSRPIQDLMARSSVPVLLVRRASDVHDAHDLDEASVHRILVAVSGTRVGRAAEELAYLLGQRFDARVRGAHVVTSEAATAAPSVGPQVDRAHALAVSFGRSPEIVVRHAPTPHQELVAAAAEFRADTLVVGATARQHEGRPFLGHGTEWLLQHAPQTVVAVVFPSGDEPA